MKKSNQVPQKTSRAKLGGVLLLSLAVIPLLLNLDMLSGNAATGSGGKITWMEFDEGVKLAKTSGKKLLVDVYTDWCTWCKKMDSDVYTSADVQKVISDHFIPVKLNAESPEYVNFNGTQMTKIQFSRAVGVTGYPATLFLNETQEPITLLPGYVPAERFSVILKYIGEDVYKHTPFESYLSQRPASN